MALTDNLIALWELEEASGTRVDAHSTNDLSDVATVTQATGKVGNAAQFTAANGEYLSIADNAALSTGDVDFMLAAWVFLDSKTTFRIIASKYGGTFGTDQEWNWLYNSSSDRFTFTLRDVSGNVSTVEANNLGSPSISVWYYIIAWHDATANTINIQVNDGTVDSMAHTTGTIDGTGAFEIGNSSVGIGLPMDGRIDQVGFWKGGFPTDGGTFAGARTALYNGGAGLSYAAMSAGGGATPSPGVGALGLTGTGNSLGFAVLMPDEP